MYNEARQAYLESQVLSAPPAKLQLLLIDAALVRAHEAQVAFEHGRSTDGWNAALRCQEVLSAILAGIDPKAGELPRRVYGLYTYLLRETCRAVQSQDASAWTSIIEILTIERDTWRSVCESVATSDITPSLSVDYRCVDQHAANSPTTGNTPTMSNDAFLTTHTVSWDA